MKEICSESELRKVIGKAPAALQIKKLKALEHHSQRYLEMSHLIAITSEKLPNRIQLVATQHCQLVIVNSKQFRLKIKIQLTDSFEINHADCGLYVLIAGFQESLRINGKLTIIRQGDISIADIEIEEHYFHCAKSIMRSEFWKPKQISSVVDQPITSVSLDSNNVTNFLKQATFLLLASQNERGETDLSPRGDPSGFVRTIDTNKVLIPERPGNRIADSLSNILVNPSIALILFIPGQIQSLILVGKSVLTSSEDILSASEVANKIPKLGIVLSVEQCYYGHNPALIEMDLWNTENFVERSTFPSLGKILADQLQASDKVPGKSSTIGRMFGKAAGSVADAAIKNDYKNNLY